MCGIIGIVSAEPFTSKDLLTRLKKLEYRGYDSFGYWNGRTITKRVGRIIVADDGEQTRTAISHTRWATHGGVTVENAHPHRSGRVTVVHNGIIENWQELRTELQKSGAVFSSETDSEVIAHLVDRKLAQGERMETILHTLVKELHGTFASLITVDGDERLYAAKRDSPLALGICDNRMIIASDIYAFSDATQHAMFFENDEYAIISAEECLFYRDGHRLEKKARKFSWGEIPEDREQYSHFMLKEINEEPSACLRLLNHLATVPESFDELVRRVRHAERVVFTAAGTAYHASLLGASLLHRHGVAAQAIIASEFENFITVDRSTLVVAVSQSGETMDVIEALKYCKRRGATIASIVNVPHSSIERMSSFSLQILAGPEVAVASTKAFTNQAMVMLKLAEAFGHGGSSASMPEKMKGVLALEHQIKKLAFDLHRHNDLYIIGRRLGYPIAREIALKVKEVSYVHAEGMMGGELKHGTIALIEQGTPVISLVFDNDPKMRASTKEVEARGARTVVIGTRKEDDILLPAKSEAEFAILAAIVGQLLAYHMALERGCPIDKPRNLAKSVTVL